MVLRDLFKNLLHSDPGLKFRSLRAISLVELNCEGVLRNEAVTTKSLPKLTLVGPFALAAACATTTSHSPALTDSIRLQPLPPPLPARKSTTMTGFKGWLFEISRQYQSSIIISSRSNGSQFRLSRFRVEEGSMTSKALDLQVE